MSMIVLNHKCCGRLSAIGLTLCAVLGFVLPAVADSAADAVMFRKPKPVPPPQQSFLLDVVPVKETKAPAPTPAPKPAPAVTSAPAPVQPDQPTWLSITKNPTNENRVVGEAAIFIAGASAFESLNWTFVSPDGGEYTPANFLSGSGA